MGLTQSTGSNRSNPSIKKYTDGEIKKNIQNLFNNNKRNNFSEATYSMKDLNNISETHTNFDLQNSHNLYPQNQLHGGGNHIKFNSSKNRHLKYNIDEYINKLQGGNPGAHLSSQNISELSEFDKIKEFLINDITNGQAGGNNDFDSLFNSLSSTSINNQTQNKKMSLLDAINMMGGAKASDDETSDDDLILDDDSDDDIDDIDDENDGDDDENDENDDDNDESDENKLPSDSDTPINSKLSSQSSSEISTTSDKPIKKNIKFSETSFSNSSNNYNKKFSTTSDIDENSSELNILPFYSSTDSVTMNEHPYIKRRFN